MLIVILASGPDKGQVHEFSDHEQITLGRTTGPIQFTDSKISRQHVKLWCEGGQWFARDLDSRHGTYRNNKPVSGQRTQLKDGDRLQIGRTVLVVSRVPVEQAAKLELLADPANAPIELPDDTRQHSVTGPRARRSRRPMRDFTWGLAAAAILGILALNVFMLVDARRQNAALRTAMQQTSPSSSGVAVDPKQLALELQKALADQPDETRQVLRDVLAAVQASPTRDQLDAAVQRIEDVRTADARRQEMLESILAEIKARPSTDPQAVAKLDEVLSAVRDQPKLTEALVNEQLALFNESRMQQEKMLRELFAAVQAQPEQINAAKSDIVAEVTAALPKPGDEAARTEALLKQVLTQLDTRGEADAAATTKMLAAIEAQPAQTRELLTQVLAKLDAQPDAAPQAAPDPRLDEVLALLKRQPKDLEPLLRDMLARMDRQAEALAAVQPPPTREQLTAAVEAAVADLPDQQAKAMRQILAEVTQRDDPADDAVLREILQSIRERPTQAQLAEAIDKALAAQPRDGEAMLKDVLAAVSAQPSKDELAEAVQAKLAQQQEASQAMLAALGDELKQRPTQEQVKQALDASLTARLAPQDELLKQVVTALAREPDPRQEQALADILAAVKAAPQDTQAMLAKVLARLDEPVTAARDPMLDEVLAAVKAQPAATQPMLEQIAAKLDQREADQAHAALLREIATAVQTQPVQTKQMVDQVLAKLDQPQDASQEAMLKEILSALKEREALDASTDPAMAGAGGDRSEQLLRQVLAELRSRSEPIAQAVLEKLRGELREQVHLALAQATAAGAAAPAPRPTATATAAATPRGPVPAAGVALFAGDTHASLDSRATTTATARDVPGLTDTQLAYKRAWETGLPELVGGRVDPASGQAIDGRLVDPTRARAMGITRWQDWYMIDDLAEQERLRMAATQFAAAKPSPLTTPLYQHAAGQTDSAMLRAAGLSTPRRVVFVLDASDSLAASMPLAVDRLHGLIESLGDEDAFTVLVYQGRGVVEVPPRGLKPATPKAAEYVVNWLKPESGNVRPAGYSNPVAALQQAMSVKPDDIFLISAQLCGSEGDALTASALLAGVQKLARDPRTRIHGIELFQRDPHRVLQRLAEQYGGTYQHVPDPSNAATAPGGAERDGG